MLRGVQVERYEKMKYSKEYQMFLDNQKEWFSKHPNKWVWIHDGSPKFFDSLSEIVKQVEYNNEKYFFAEKLIEDFSQQLLMPLPRQTK